MKSVSAPAVRWHLQQEIMEEPDSQGREAAGSCSIVLDGKAGPNLALALFESARQAIAGSGDVSVSCATLEGIDTRSVQILLALQRELVATGRSFRMLDVPEAIARQLAATGLVALAAAQTDGVNDGA
jgi:ABC-type transporter Mla MlaB component